jgi:hypothetical protein
MSTNLSSLLDELYRKDHTVSSLEKTAEDSLVSALRAENQVADNPYSSMSTAELAQLALEMEQGEKVASETPELLEKIAADTIGGQVMAHAMVHEFSLIKQAMANGLCRVCKENGMDVQGSSICSACAQAE